MRYRPWNNACRVLEQQMYRLRRTVHVYATWNNACDRLRGTMRIIIGYVEQRMYMLLGTMHIAGYVEQCI